MASSSLLTLIDDIASLLDDVALMTKVAAQKTTGVLGDDLALNAQQVSGVQADRELSVVWAVAKGSLLNKVVLVPLALTINALAPWAVQALLMLGGAYLCLEGFEKLAHKFLHSATSDAAVHEEQLRALAAPGLDLASFERDKVRGAIRTDFVLSAEIIVIALGVVQQANFTTQVLVLAGIALAITLGVYGLVAAIVKLDDAGLYLSRRNGAGAQAIGQFMLRAAPWLMRGLTVVGTLAMFLVGGSILAHGVAPVGHAIEALVASRSDLLASTISTLLQGLFGVLAGGIALWLLSLWQRLLKHR